MSVRKLVHNSPSSPSNCSMARTALSCVLWWRWLGILVMFHGMDLHSGIRTGSQDAARMAGGHSAHDTASRDTDSPGEKSMMVRSGTSAGTVKVQPVQVKSRPGRGFPPLIGAFLLLLWDLLEGGAAASRTLPPPSFLHLPSSPFLTYSFSSPPFFSYPPPLKTDSF